MIQRGGQVMLHMLANVQKRTIKPIIPAAVTPGTLIHTDEYAIYARLPSWGYGHKTVCHAPEASMPTTKKGTASARSTSTPWKAFGPCSAPGCDRIGAFRKTSCRSISA